MGECIEIVQYPVYPIEVTITFAQPDGATAENDGGGEVD